MNFVRKKALKKNGYFPVNLGICKINGDDVPCIQRQLSEKDLNNIVRITNDEKFNKVLERYGPQVYHTEINREHDDQEIKHFVYHEVVECISIDEYCSTIDIRNDRDIKKIQGLFSSITEYVNFMKSLGLSPHIMHLDSAIVCKNGNIKISFEEILHVSRPQEDAGDFPYDFYMQIRNIILQNSHLGKDFQEDAAKLLEQEKDRLRKINEAKRSLIHELLPKDTHEFFVEWEKQNWKKEDLTFK